MIKRVTPVCFYARDLGELGSPKYTFISNGKYEYHPKEKPPLPCKGSFIILDRKPYIVEDTCDEGTFPEDGNRTRIIVKLEKEPAKEGATGLPKPIQ